MMLWLILETVTIALCAHLWDGRWVSQLCLKKKTGVCEMWGGKLS